MSDYPFKLDLSEIRNCSDMEAVVFFYQQSMNMIDYFSENSDKIANAKRMEGKWTALETVSHILYWDHLFLEKRMKPLSEGVQKLESLNDDEINIKSIQIASKGLNHLIDDLERSRKQITDFLGELTTEQWEFYAIHPEWKRVDQFRLIEELIKHDYHHGKFIAGLIS